MMSDHLAGMNEKLTQQKDEIDDLKSQAANATKQSSSSSSSKVSLDFNQVIDFQACLLFCQQCQGCCFTFGVAKDDP